MQAEAAVHQAGQHADVGLRFVLAEELASELGGAVVGAQPAQLATLFARRAVGCGASLFGEGLGRGAHRDQRLFGALTQGLHVHAGCHGEQDVAGLHALALCIASRVRGVKAPAGGLVWIGHLDGLVQPAVDGVGRGFADDAVAGRRVIDGQQAIFDGGQAQQGEAGELAALGFGQLFGLLVQHVVTHAQGAGGGEGIGGGDGVHGHLLARVQRGRPVRRLRTTCHGRIT